MSKRRHEPGRGPRFLPPLLPLLLLLFLFLLLAPDCPTLRAQDMDLPRDMNLSDSTGGAGERNDGLPAARTTAASGGYSATVTDRDNREYRLAGFRRYRYEHFNCRLRDRFFELEFGRVRSVTFVEQPGTTVKGFAMADVQLAGGESVRLYIGTSGEQVRGSVDSLGIEISLPMADVSSIVFRETTGLE